jgi:hypothetical protein
MGLIYVGPTEAAPLVSRGVWLIVVLFFLSGGLIKPADGQSRNVVGKFLAEARINGSSAVLLIDTGAERSLLDRDFALRLGLSPAEVVNIQRPDSAGQTEVVIVTDLDIQSVYKERQSHRELRKQVMISDRKSKLNSVKS